MDANFWLQRWRENRTGFHEGHANAMLVKHFEALALGKYSRVLIPLCGKTADIGWLLAQGHRVLGVELSELAVRQLFEGLGVEPEIAAAGPLIHYSAPDLEVFVGDILALSGAVSGTVDAVYDRAALVALPAGMRGRYASHLTGITDAAPQLLVCFEYDQAAMDGPPFSVDGQEVARLYGARHEVTRLDGIPVAGGLKGKCPAQEVAWLLS